MSLSDPELVRREYETVDRLAVRRLDRTGWLRGFDEVFVLLRAVAEVRPRRVLDAGCGSGDWATLIAAPDVFGVDSSEAAVAAARVRGVEAVVGDVADLPFEDESFDVVMCNAVLYHLPDPNAGLREFARVLRAGGRFVGGYTVVPEHLDELWSAVGHRPVVDGADAFDGATGDRHLGRHFASVERREVGGEVSWETRAELQTYLDAYVELIGPLDAPLGPYPFRARRRTCVFVAEKSVVSRIRQTTSLCDHEKVTSVLIVDDHPSFRASARALLEAEGFDVIGEASNGESAVQACDELHPDVVLLDVQLPDRTGFEVASQLTRNGSTINVVLVSSRDCCDYGTLVEESGASGFVPKGELTGARIVALLR